MKGRRNEAVIGLGIGGAGLCMREMSLLAGIFNSRLVIAFVAAVCFTAMVARCAFNLM